VTGSDTSVLFRLLHRHYGDQHWWPAETPFEMMVGAILTQNTSWTNVEIAITNLKQAGLLSAQKMASVEPEMLEPLIRPSGYFRQKATRLTGFARFLLDHESIDNLKRLEAGELRRLLLSVNGIGPETADSMLLYALDVPIFVVDAYTKRIFSRLGNLPESSSYGHVQRHFMDTLAPSLPIYQEYHALIVKHAKDHCRVKPLCDGCPLLGVCEHGKKHVD